MARKINAAGVALLRSFEGEVLHVYKDEGGKDTIGIGHLIKPGEHFTTITHDEALTLLDQDVSPVELEVEKLVKVPLTDNQFSALVCFAFNVGCGALAGSTLLHELNVGLYARVPIRLAVWDHVDGAVSDGLKRRRAAEAALWTAR